YIYKGLKPVYWCPVDETALAEAEIEYADDPCKSVYVKFRVKDDLGKFEGLCDPDKTYFIIWTTTIWTLPGNLAIAVHPRESYALIKADNGEYYITAEALAEKTMKAGGVESYEIVKTFAGGEFEYMKAAHPFLDRESVLLTAEYVTMESGTGCVHTAPGFGADDYMTCMRYKIDIIVPVDDKGYQTEEAGKYAGLRYDESNEVIYNDMKADGSLFASEDIVHQYPHCWRCKNPIIFRGTPQWFCSVESFKDEALKACDEVEWMPAWGQDRMKSMIRERADWCISRQRHWGLPIPVFYCKDCGRIICDDSTIDKISEVFGEKGSNAWFELDVKELMPEGYTCPDCGSGEFEIETDTLDGWFDSGSTHFSVLDDSKGLHWPADLYLEGADQYRGWFQSSLLTAVGAGGKGAPYKAVLTHGWVVDGEGKAMHKSLGNGVAAEDAVKKYGADLLRLWVASSEFRVDVRVSDDIFKQLSEAYRKIRNTVRMFMANLGKPDEDFDPDKNMVPLDQLYDIDKWALSRMNKLVASVRRAYDDFEFHMLYHDIVNFCTLDMSKLYIDIVKDRLYVEKKDSLARRSAQTAMYIILDTLTRLLAPILSFTTMEIWENMYHDSSVDSECVLFNDMPSFEEKYAFTDIEEKWDVLFDLRDDVLKPLEEARASKLIGKSLEAKLLIKAHGEKFALLKSFEKELPAVFIVSQVELEEVDSGFEVVVEKADGEKCDRCWTFTTDFEKTEEGCLCARCRRILG
ncbi:MAG: isoleucine--tRNA ligase, partial [Clostridia bacterium]|nr:isoleucine--tRNA ligase [Clostridia bacterium]